MLNTTNMRGPMNPIRSRLYAVLGGFALLFAASIQAQTPAAGQAWPTRPVRWIVPFAPGGGSDAVARLMAQKLTEKWGQQVVVENKPGANTTIAAVEAARAAPDGYTLFQAINSTLTLNPYAFSKLPYQPMRDFTHIALISEVPMVIISNASVPVKSFAELVTLAKAQPGVLTIGGGSVGAQLMIERFSRDAKIKLLYVPYKSGIDVTKGLLSGEIQLGMDGAAQYLQLLQGGKVRILATNSPQRASSLPNVPTLVEAGYRNSEAGVWNALVAPAGLPSSIRDKIAQDLRDVLAAPDVKEKLSSLGLEPKWGSADQLVKLIESEGAAMEPLVKELGLKMD